MTVTFMYEPVANVTSFQHGTSSDHTALTDTFGTFPVELDQRDVATLRAMGRAARNPLYEEIADTIERVGEIRLSAQY